MKPIIEVLGWHDNGAHGSCQVCSTHINIDAGVPITHRVFTIRICNAEIRMCALALECFQEEYKEKIRYVKAPPILER